LALEARRSPTGTVAIGVLAVTLPVVLLIMLAFAVTSPAAEPATTSAKAPAGGAVHKYIGVEKCGVCHKAEAKGNQLGQWQKSAHAHAFETLAGEKALAIAKEKGLTTPPQENDACLKCHLTGHGLPADRFEASFVKTHGVQCESCHGPGSDYKTMTVMKSRDASVAAGLVLPTEAVCVTCHNKESPTFTEFKFAEMLAKVAHPRPKAEAK
jgi:hypothetical protein